MRLYLNIATDVHWLKVRLEGATLKKARGSEIRVVFGSTGRVIDLRHGKTASRLLVCESDGAGAYACQ